MKTQTLTARGIVREGLVVPLGDDELPEGAEVEIRVVAPAMNLDAVSEALSDAERWRRFSEENSEFQMADDPLAERPEES